ncbi:MAG: DUF896 domain-containing protein [Lachnospiraceae bacterium]|nr:DUF896 domain-containing protein [Lachnospiraceae bacterium]
MTDEKIKRINELAHKSKTPEGLTKEEKKEQAVLRQEFIDSVKGNLKAQLDNINIQEKDGSITHVRDIPKKKK